MSNRPLYSLRQTETLELESGLSLIPCIKLLLTIYRADKSEDLEIRKFKYLNKRKREEPVERGPLFVHDIGFLKKVIGENEDDWRRVFVEKMDGIELNLEGTKFKLNVALPVYDDFVGMKKEWEEIIAFGARGYQKSGRLQPDTIVLKGMPSRWFAETRVSSKPSMLVTHTIISALGKIRADYDVTWDKDRFFRDTRHQIEERKRIPARMEERDGGHRQHSQVSQFSSEEGRRKRFKE
ncbi:unnamed protein product [Withania somnifera]